jgi:hypothetical protein
VDICCTPTPVHREGSRLKDQLEADIKKVFHRTPLAPSVLILFSSSIWLACSRYSTLELLRTYSLVSFAAVGSCEHTLSIVTVLLLSSLVRWLTLVAMQDVYPGISKSCPFLLPRDARRLQGCAIICSSTYFTSLSSRC